MLKFLVVVIILAVPIVCAEEIYEGNKKKLVVQGPSEENFKLQCKNVSGIDIDVQRNDRLYEEFKECAKNAIDFETFDNEVKIVGGYIGWYSTSGGVRSPMEAKFPLVEIFIQKYCPNLINFIPCDDILSPIYTECFSAKNIQTKTMMNNYFLRSLQFVCKNNAEEAIKLVNGKFLECGYAKQSQVLDCLQPVIRTQIRTTENHLVDPDVFCSTFESFKDCVLPIFEQCELSDTPFKLLKSLFKEIQKGNTCT